MLLSLLSTMFVVLVLQERVIKGLSTEAATAAAKSEAKTGDIMSESEPTSTATMAQESAEGETLAETKAALPEITPQTTRATDWTYVGYEAPSFVLTAREGTISWEDNSGLSLTNVSWLISLAPDQGVFVTVAQAVRTQNCTFALFAGNTTNPDKSLLDDHMKGLPQEPLLVPSNQVLFLSLNLTSENACHFQLNYSGLALSSMPTFVNSSDWRGDGAGVLSRRLYNCSAPSVRIPPALQCDMVQQCFAGEDEGGCDYHTNGCSGWILHSDLCYKIVLREDNFTFPVSLPGDKYIFSAYARYQCQSRFGARLGIFPNRASRELMVTLALRAGFGGVKLAIGLEKVKAMDLKLSRLYRFIWQWGGRGSAIAYQQIHTQRLGTIFDCAYLLIDEDGPTLLPYGCESPLEGYICVKDKSGSQQAVPSLSPNVVNLAPSARVSFKFQTKVCSDGSHVHIFHPCPASDDALGFSGWSQHGFSLFQCATLHQQVHFTLVCDGKFDCADRSDESACSEARLPPIQNSFFTCRQFQLVQKHAVCNGLPDCFDESDEENCFWCEDGRVRCPGRGCMPKSVSVFIEDCRQIYMLGSPVIEINTVWPPAVVELDGMGMSNVTALPPGQPCPESHFQCPSGFCIPTYLLNNGERDCPSGEDENITELGFTCPGFYRCYDYENCVHIKYVCDGIPHCPDKDDELYCDLTCPANCICEGHAFMCRQMFHPAEYPQVRYLDLSGTLRPQLANLQVMEYLFFLNLSRCAFTDVILQNLLRLRILDLSFNDISSLQSLKLEKLESLQHLNVSGNNFLPAIDAQFSSFIQLAGLQELRTLSLQSVGIQSMTDNALQLLSKLTALDLRGNSLENFDKNVLEGLVKLDSLWADNSKLCCSYFQQVTIKDCYAPEDELSSCQGLLRSDFFRVCLWLFSVLAIVGNVGVLAYRVCVEKRDSSSASFRVLVINLCVSDLLMGCYLMIIGSTDIHLQGVYVEEEEKWKNSSLCKIAGFLSFLSSEASALLIILISLDRLLVLRFPFTLHLQLNVRTAMVACGVTWMIGMLLAVVPLLPVTAHWEFYSQNAICLPLPITRKKFPGETYAFAIFVVLNFVLFLAIGLGQVYIFCIIRRANRAARKERRRQEKTIAARLLLVVLTNFFCSFPVSVMGLLASGGMSIEGVVNIWAAIFVLPLNAALDPFLYTLNTALDRRHKQLADRHVERVLNQLHVELNSWPADKVDVLFRDCLRSMPPEKIEMWMCSGRRVNIVKKSSNSRMS